MVLAGNLVGTVMFREWEFGGEYVFGEGGQLLLVVKKWFFSVVILHVANNSSINAAETMLQIQNSVALKRMLICQLKVHFKFNSFKEDADMLTETALEVLHRFKPTNLVPPLETVFLVPFKGASDVVLDIHHGEKRFVGFTIDTKSLDADVNRKCIYGAQVGAYTKIFGLILHGPVSPHIDMVKVFKEFHVYMHHKSFLFKIGSNFYITESPKEVDK
nr:hypothetical protein [Tanacetum cinerariifolium]